MILVNNNALIIYWENRKKNQTQINIFKIILSMGYFKKLNTVLMSNLVLILLHGTVIWLILK